MVDLNVQQVFQRPLEHAQLMRHRHRRMPLGEIHAGVELDRPVRRAGDHPGIHPEVAVALVEQREIALHLAGDVLQRLAGQRVRIAKDEALAQVQRMVAPSPVVAVALELEPLRVVGGQVGHQHLKGVPGRLLQNLDLKFVPGGVDARKMERGDRDFGLSTPKWNQRYPAPAEALAPTLCQFER